MDISSTGWTLKDKLPQVGTTIFSVMSQMAQDTGSINLSQGFPDFPPDPALHERVAKAMRDGHAQYAPMPGLPSLREALAIKAQRLYGHGYDPATEVTITAGATQALFSALAALIGPGDEVIIIDPAYDCYAPTVALFGATPVHVSLNAAMAFDADVVEAALSPRTRVLMINTPHNPGGGIMRAAEMQRIADMLRGTNVVLISDEVYEHLIFDDEPHASVIRHPELRERALVVFSFGKVFHATGWKVGYVFAPRLLMTLFRKVHQYTVFSVNTPMQHALADHLHDPAHYDGLAAFFQAKRDHFAQGLAGSRFTLLPCAGTYFQVVDYSNISDMPDLAFAEWLAREHGVASIPLSPFYKAPPQGQRLLRFCFAKLEATLDAAIGKLCAI